MTKENIVDIKIRCPACQKSGNIQVEEYAITHSARGVSAINVSEDFICKHSFVAYVDRNLTVRDCFICDFQIEIPKIVFRGEIEVEEKEIDFDVDIVKINLIPSLLINILQGIFFGKQLIVLFEEDFIGKNLVKFFQYITEGSFKLDLEIISKDYYKKNKKSYKDMIVLEKGNIILDKAKSIIKKNNQIESVIAQKFFSELDGESSLIIIKNEFNKTYRLTERLKDCTKGLQEGHELKSKTALEYFKKEYNIELDLNYLKFLMNILEVYFGVKVKKAPESADFLSLL